MKKKQLAILLCVSMLASMLIGCGGTKTEGGSAPAEQEVQESAPAEQEAQESAPAEEEAQEAPSEESAQAPQEHMEISVAYWGVETYLGSRDTDRILQDIEEKFNVTFVPMNITWDDYGTKEQLWASSDSLPDIAAVDIRNTKQFSEWANDGVIRPVPEDLSAYPHLAAYLDYPSMEGCKVDGVPYAIFRLSNPTKYHTALTRWILYRWDLAQAAGVEKEPENWQEFCDMIQAIVEADPEGKNISGMTALDTAQLKEIFLSYAKPEAVVSGTTFKWVDNGDGTYIPAYFAGENLGDDMLPAWNLLRDMYENNVIEHDISLTTQDMAKNKFLNGQAAALLGTNSLETMADAWLEIHGTPVEEDVKYLDLMPSVDGNTYFWETETAWSESVFGSAVDDAKMDRILQIYDYLCSDEGIILADFGYEGETFNVENGEAIVTVEGGLASLYPSAPLFQSLVAWLPNLTVEGYQYHDPVPQWKKDWMADYLEQAQNTAEQSDVPECTTAFVASGSNFGLHIDDDLVIIMTGERPVEEMWQEIIEDYEKDGLEEAIALVNEAVK